ncbi:MAG: nickel pincer cofactor biosynthesis protein LarB [Candidatus Fimadaptatus sp.]
MSGMGSAWEDDKRRWLERVRTGELGVDEALEELRRMPVEDLGYAMVDHHRQIRQGVPEVIYCAGKTPEQTAGIARSLLSRSGENLLCTRAGAEHYEAVRAVEPSAEYHAEARIVRVMRNRENYGVGRILVLTGGTSDIPVAEEAALTAETLGNEVGRIYDVGVAGIHRLLSRTDEIMRANVLIAVAGMEGALASVVAGLVDRPVIAVPTSVGYGANFGGLSALLTMINSCASGVSTVNIDNGFGAGYMAALINRPGRSL